MQEQNDVRFLASEIESNMSFFCTHGQIQRKTMAFGHPSSSYSSPFTLGFQLMR